jgi:hypothetical protein
MDSFPVERLIVQGRVTVLPLLAQAIATVNVPVATRVRALSTYQSSEQMQLKAKCTIHTEVAAKPNPPTTAMVGLSWRS